MRDSKTGLRDHQRTKLSCRRVRLAAAIFGVLPLVGGCAHSVKQSAQVAEFNPPARPLVLSGSPQRDSLANDLSDQQLSEADWRLLQSLGPKAIWERIAEMNRSARERRVVAAPTTSPNLPKNSSTRPVELAKAIETAIKDTPVVNLPDGRVRLIYNLKNYGGTTVKAATDGGTSRRIVTSTPPDLTPLVSALATQLGDGSTIAPLPTENTLIITCQPAMKDSVLGLLAQLDQPARQVEITAKMFEVSHDFDFQYGAQILLNHVAADGSQSLASTFSTKSFANSLATNGTTNSASTDGSVLRLMRVFQDAGISVDATFQALAESGLINVVASPRMTVAIGQTGYMLAGSEIPIQATTIVNGATQATTTYKPVGVQLYITPQSSAQDTVKLHAITVVSSVSGFVPLPTITGVDAPSKLLVNPILDSREAETTVTIENGNTLVFGGLRMIRTTSRESKLPGLGDIPILGLLFKNHRSQKQQTDLYFFVTPQLL
jgi:type II secretory pathway component GspD/PulD (secretin)